MAGAADFTVIRRDPITPLDPTNDTHTDTFTLPSDVDVQQPAILGLLVDTNAANNLRLRVLINDHPVESTAPYKGDVFHTIDEIIVPIDAQHGTLKKGTSNTITYHLQSGTGTVACSDVVLWWRHVAPPR
jgi:hypothetical protein